MIIKAVLELSGSTYQEIIRHVLPHGSHYEEAVFIFAHHDAAGVFTPVGMKFVPSDGFENRSTYFLELTEEMQRALFKQAHDLRASIIEIHSHPMQVGAEFSGSDIYGFREFVPRARWRTKDRPYGAVVMAPQSFDSLAWFDTIETPVPMDIRLDGVTVHHPTGTSHSDWGKVSWNYGYSIPKK
jgi:hypothetical protein